jgi:tetratricopeptide (TPR) repeat protein
LKSRARLAVAWLCLFVAGAAHAQDPGTTDRQNISLRRSAPVAAETTEEPFSEAPRGFEFSGFEARLESLWFQRKVLLADVGREADAARMAEKISALCSAEGVTRLDTLSVALVVEAQTLYEQGRFESALDSLNFAAKFDSSRPDIHLLRAAIFWKSGQGYLAAGGELLSAFKQSLVKSIRELSIFNRLMLILLSATLACIAIFSVLMMLRYQIPFRHEVEEWLGQVLPAKLAHTAGWAFLFLPLLLWFAAGWLMLYWIVITFRFMRSNERVAAVALLSLSLLAIPAYSMTVSLYGLSADPFVRATLVSAGGDYAPDRIIKLQRLVDAAPQNPVYHFLLGGVYKNGNYFEEAFSEYQQALTIDPGLKQAYINIANVFYATSQYAEAIAHYRKALDLDQRSVLAMFNMHLAQSELFQLALAEETLNLAREIDAAIVADLLGQASANSRRPEVIDATLNITSIWDAALTGRSPRLALAASEDGADQQAGLLGRMMSASNVIILLALLACGVMMLVTRHQPAARTCIRCGQPFCHYCKSGREGHEYCSQCLHLFVLGDGLAPEAKQSKLYEVERHDRRSKLGRRWLSRFLPGAAQLLNGKAGWGVMLLLLWFAAWTAWVPTIFSTLERYLGIDQPLGLLRPHSITELNSLAILGFLMAIVVWTVGNIWNWRGKQA